MSFTILDTFPMNPELIYPRVYSSIYKCMSNECLHPTYLILYFQFFHQKTMLFTNILISTHANFILLLTWINYLNVNLACPNKIT